MTRQVKQLSPEQQALHDAALRATGTAEHTAKANFGILNGSEPIQAYDLEGKPEHIVTGLE
jgi:hypothetical protein